MPAPGKIRLLVLHKDSTYVIFEQDQMQEVADYVKEHDDCALFKLEGYIRRTSDNQKEPSVRSTKLWPK
jgi:hypothetical protein